MERDSPLFQRLEAPPFLGSYEMSLDDKRRLPIPKPFREQMEGRNETPGPLYLMPAFRGAPFIAAYDSFEFNLQRIIDAAEKDEAKRLIRGAFVKNVDPDQQGRIVIPEGHSTHASFNGKIVVAASPNMGNLELWTPSAFNHYYRPALTAHGEIHHTIVEVDGTLFITKD